MIEAKESLIGNEERRNVITMHYGDRQKFLIADLQKEVKKLQDARKEKGMSPIIRINKIHIHETRETSVKLYNVRDPESGVLYGIPAGIHKDGNIMWSMIELKDRNEFNLNLDLDARRYLVVRMYSKIKGSPFEVSPEFEIHDSEIDAIAGIEKSDYLVVALSRVADLKGNELKNFARYAGVNVEDSMTDNIIKNEINQLAMSDPKDVLSKLDSKKRGIMEIYKGALDYGIVFRGADGYFMYGEISLGNSDGAICQFFEENMNILHSVGAEFSRKIGETPKPLTDKLNKAGAGNASLAEEPVTKETKEETEVKEDNNESIELDG